MSFTDARSSRLFRAERAYRIVAGLGMMGMLCVQEMLQVDGEVVDRAAPKSDKWSVDVHRNVKDSPVENRASQCEDVLR